MRILGTTPRDVTCSLRGVRRAHQAAPARCHTSRRGRRASPGERHPGVAGAISMPIASVAQGAYIVGTITSPTTWGRFPMQGLVIVHEGDLGQVDSLVTRDGRLTGEIWDIQNCSFECCRFYIKDDNTGGLLDSHGSSISPAEVAQRYSVIILIAAHHAVDDERLREILNHFLSGEDSPPWSNETVIVLGVVPTAARSELRNLEWSERVFFAPTDSLADPPEFGSDAWVRHVHSRLGGLTRMIDENQTRNPNVGFGLLLVDSDCNCFLMERQRDPGRGKLGTIGGNFERGHTIAEELTQVLERRFRRGRGPQVDLGPLLSCTNMKNDFMHYIDLTFLGIVKGGRVSDVNDRELRLLGRETLKLLNSEDSGPRPSNASGARRMFTLAEVAVFYRADRLFTPVANAFEALCRTIFTEQLRHGLRERIFFPSLIDNGRMLELQLPEDPDCVRKIVAGMQNNRNALPFFEGGIS